MVRKPYHFKFFKGCLPQILPGPFLNTLTHIWSEVSVDAHILDISLVRKAEPLRDLL